MAEVAANIQAEEETSASNVTNKDNSLGDYSENFNCDDKTGAEVLSACDKHLDLEIDNTILLFDDNTDDLYNKTEDVIDSNLCLYNNRNEIHGYESELENRASIKTSSASYRKDEKLPVNQDCFDQKLQDEAARKSDADKEFTKSVDEVLRIYSEHEVLSTSDVECSDGAKDLIQRLLNPDPQKRLRSLLSLQNIRFFKDFNFADTRTKKVSPHEIILIHFPNGPLAISEEISKLDDEMKTFIDFDIDLNITS